MTQHLGQERVVVAFSDVFGPLPTGGEQQPSLVDFDTILNQQYGNGTFRSGEFGIGDWPGIARHGLVVLDSLRETQLREVARLGITPEEAAAMTAAEATARGLRKYEYDTVKSVGSQALVGIANYAPRTTELRDKERNGAEFHYARTKSGVEVVAHPEFLRDLRDEGRLEPGTLARIPNQAAVDAGVWPPGEQYRSRFASRLVDHPEIHEKVPENGPDSPIGYDPRPNGGASYVDKFGNTIIAQHDIRQAGALLRENIGGKVDMVLTRITDGEEIAVRGVAVVQSLGQAPDSTFSVYLNPAEYKLGAPLPHGSGHVELACRVDNPNNASGSSYMKLAETLDEGLPGGFDSSQLDQIDVRFDA